MTNPKTLKSKQFFFNFRFNWTHKSRKTCWLIYIPPPFLYSLIVYTKAYCLQHQKYSISNTYIALNVFSHSDFIVVSVMYIWKLFQPICLAFQILTMEKQSNEWLKRVKNARKMHIEVEIFWKHKFNLMSIDVEK